MREQSSERNTETSKDLVTIPEGSHPFPSRTRKLRSPGLMILGPQGPGKVSRCQVVQETIDYDGLFALGQITHQCVIWHKAFKFSWVEVLSFFLVEKTRCVRRFGVGPTRTPAPRSRFMWPCGLAEMSTAHTAGDLSREAAWRKVHSPFVLPGKREI
ncbi:Hypothetical protein DPCES_0399 [Desulfitobacterium hafniense]|uniref:Uncharacterized protein n=1 Tax=Desulfitobacterium hafniense TaxID=49338 RepID=A0A098AXE5_DESHA|nr:Hypothetical protein DPCES_0399 [Desulfitobacterium hafniense]